MSRQGARGVELVTESQSSDVGEPSAVREASHDAAAQRPQVQTLNSTQRYDNFLKNVQNAENQFSFPVIKMNEIFGYVTEHLNLGQHRLVWEYLDNLSGEHEDMIRTQVGTSLHWALLMEDIPFAFSILQGKNGDNFDSANVLGNTPLHLAAKLGNLEIVKILLPYTSLGKKNCLGLTALELALRNRFEDVAEEIRSHAISNSQSAGVDPGTAARIAREVGFFDMARRILEESDEGRQFTERMYRNRQVYIDSANAILVGAALIASISFVSWLQPPMGLTSYYEESNSSSVSAGSPRSYPYHADLRHNPGLKAFWVFNSLSFYFAIATFVFGAHTVLPQSHLSLSESVYRVGKLVVRIAFLLAFSVLFVIVAFAIARCIVLAPEFTNFQLYMISMFQNTETKNKTSAFQEEKGRNP